MHINTVINMQSLRRRGVETAFPCVPTEKVLTRFNLNSTNRSVSDALSFLTLLLYVHPLLQFLNTLLISWFNVQTYRPLNDYKHSMNRRCKKNLYPKNKRTLKTKLFKSNEKN